MKKMITRRNFLKAAGVSAAALGLAACGGSSSSTSTAASGSAAASSTAASGADGKVYYLNFKPEQDEAWQNLAAAYTEETGVPVTVVTAASGQYETTLMSEMEKSEAPTLFQVNGPVGLANWKDYCYDLSGKGTYLDNYKQIWDLYITDSTCDPKLLASKTGNDAVAEFVDKKAVFYQNGTWAYGDISSLGDDNLGMLPIYIGAEGEENQGLCTGSENFWCVNNQSSEADIQATLDFLYWCVTSDKGTAAMADDMGFVIPFKKAKDSTNPLIAIANDYVAAGKTSVDWCFSTMPSEEWKNGVGSALTAYAAGTGDWDAVVTAFVDGWASEYKLANG